MDGERDKILKMLEEGTISAEEAEELLAAIDDSTAVEASYEEPDPPQFHPNWQAPFAVSLFVFLLGGSGLLRTRGATGVPRLLSRLFFWPVTILAGLTAVITYLSKDGPWLHLRVKSSDGDRFALSLPFPLHLLRGGLRLATTQAEDEETRSKIDAAADFLEAVETADITDPVTIDIQDEGDSVQIFLG